MERIEIVSRVNSLGIRFMNCRMLTDDESVGCNNCVISKWLRDNKLNKLMSWEVFKELGLIEKEKENHCYTLYGYIYKKNIEKKVAVWKNLK